MISVERQDDSDRDYARDAAGKFASTGEAADHAAEHAELARAAAAGTSHSAARGRARQAVERAALARVAHEHGDLPRASMHAVAAERHAEHAIRHSGDSPWQVRAQMVAEREVERARATGDHDQRVKAHVEAARVYGATSAAGRRHYGEAHDLVGQTRGAGHAADVARELAGVGLRIGGGGRVRGAAEEPPQTEVHTIQEPSRQVRVGVTPVESNGESPPPSPPAAPPPRREPVVGAGDRRVGFGYTHRERAPTPSAGRHFSDASDRRSSVAGVRPAHVVELSSPPSQRPGLLARFLGRRDSADFVRWWLGDRYLVDVASNVAVSVASRLLGVQRQDSAGALLVETLVAIARRDSDEWDDAAHPRDELGRFGEGGGHADRAYQASDAARAAARGTTPAARSSARKAEASARAAHLAAVAGDHAAAAGHAASAERHAAAVRQKLDTSPRVVQPTLLAVKPSTTPSTTTTTSGGGLPSPVATGFVHGGFTSEAQRAVRSHHDAILAGYGMSGAKLSGSGDVTVVPSSSLAGARATHGSDDGVTMSTEIASHLSRFAGQTPREWGVQLLRERDSSANHLPREDTVKAIEAYRVSTHEAIHGKGATRFGSYKGSGMIVEEVTTEMSARRVVRDAIGVHEDDPIHLSTGLGQVGGSYARYIGDVTRSINKVAGGGRGAAHRELERASLAFKGRPPSSTFISPEVAVKAFVSHVDFSAVSGKSHTSEESDRMRADLERHINELTPKRRRR